MAKRMIEIPEDIIDAIRDDVIAECKREFPKRLLELIEPDPFNQYTIEGSDDFLQGYRRACEEMAHPSFEF